VSNTNTEKDTVIDKELSGERLQSRKRERFTIGTASRVDTSTSLEGLKSSVSSLSAYSAQDWPDDRRKQEAPAWILIAVHGFISIIGFYLLWLRVGGETARL
jgi:hypothetical protein